MDSHIPANMRCSNTCISNTSNENNKKSTNKGAVGKDKKWKGAEGKKQMEGCYVGTHTTHDPFFRFYCCCHLPLLQRSLHKPPLCGRMQQSHQPPQWR